MNRVRAGVVRPISHSRVRVVQYAVRDEVVGSTQ